MLRNARLRADSLVSVNKIEFFSYKVFEGCLMLTPFTRISKFLVKIRHRGVYGRINSFMTQWKNKTEPDEVKVDPG